jgi:hypothetical protein
MEKSLLHAIAQLPEEQQDEAIDGLVDVIIAEGLTEEQVARLQVVVVDIDEPLGLYGPN